MFKNISIKEIKEYLKQNNSVDLYICTDKKDVNHILSAKMEFNISNINELDEITKKWNKFSDLKSFQYCIWVDKDDEFVIS